MSLLELKGVETFYGASQALFGVDSGRQGGRGRGADGPQRHGQDDDDQLRFSALRGRAPERSASPAARSPACGRTASHGWASGLCPKDGAAFPTSPFWKTCLPPRAAASGRWRKSIELFPRLGERRDQFANTLSGGEQQMLAIGRALMTNPSLLILDEATEGLAPVIRQDIWAAIRKLKASGQSILVVDKTLSELLPVADRCFVLEKGVTVFEGAPKALTPELQDRYLGV